MSAERATIVVFGASGQVGFELVRQLGAMGRVVPVTRSEVDLGEPDSIRRFVVAQKPALVVNASAFTAVDAAEERAQEAHAVNARAPGAMAAAAEEVGAAFVHYSTDYVFDGAKGEPYTEDDPPNPISVYGASKLAGEEAVLAAASAAVVLRTSWVYSSRGRNFLNTMLRLGAERPELRVVDDQVGAPTAARPIASATALLWRGLGGDDGARTEAARRLRGVYHLTAAGSTSWYGFTREIARLAFRPETHACTRVVPITTAEYPTPARRPANSRLSNAKFAATFGLVLPAWEEQLRLTLEEMAG